MLHVPVTWEMGHGKNGHWAFLAKWPLGLPCRSDEQVGDRRESKAHLALAGSFFLSGSYSEVSHDFMLNSQSNRQWIHKNAHWCSHHFWLIVLPCCQYGRNPSAPVLRVSLPVVVCHLRVLLLKLGTILCAWAPLGVGESCEMGQNHINEKIVRVPTLPGQSRLQTLRASEK